MNKCCKKIISLLLLGLLTIQITACGNKEEELCAFYASSDNVVNTDIGEYVIGKTTPLFTENKVCYVTDDMLSTDENVVCAASLLIDVTNNKFIQGENIYKKVYPASITKLLTAYLIIKYGNLEDMYTITADNCGITEAGAQLIGFKKGDVISISDLIYCLLVYSGNDSGVALAEYLCGSEEAFCVKMNEEAKILGLSGTHFTNPHGLHDTEHYTTAYDMYILLSKCMESEFFRKVSQTDNYEFSVKQEDGQYRSIHFSTTNKYKLGAYELPQGITILGAKTGNTLAAGPCLIQYISDADGNEYVAAVFGAKNKDILYDNMTYLMNKVSSAHSNTPDTNDNSEQSED